MTSRFYYTARYISWVLSEIIELLRKIHLGYIRIQQDTLILQDTLTIHAIYIRIRIR